MDIIDFWQKASWPHMKQVQGEGMWRVVEFGEGMLFPCHY